MYILYVMVVKTILMTLVLNSPRPVTTIVLNNFSVFTLIINYNSLE